METVADDARPSTSPGPARASHTSHTSHTSHAMMLQVSEYRARVRQAVASTFQSALQPPPLRLDARPVSSSLSSASRRVAAPPASAPAAAYYAGAPLAKDAVLPRRAGGYVAFHKMQARRGEFLLGESADRRAARMLAGASSVSTPAGIAKDHFALGPGQYDVAAGATSSSCCSRGGGLGAKFSPADRFRDDYSAGERPGPGQYATHAGEALVSPRAAAAVFSQVPRRTDESLLLPAAALGRQPAPSPSRPPSPSSSPRRWSGRDEGDDSEAVPGAEAEATTAVSGCGRSGYPAASSWYYYQPPSGFAPKYARQNDRESWPRAPRFTGRHRWQRASAPAADASSAATDFVEANKRQVLSHAAVQRMRRARGAEQRSRQSPPPPSPLPPPATFKRRQSLFEPPSPPPLDPDGADCDTGHLLALEEPAAASRTEDSRSCAKRPSLAAVPRRGSASSAVSRDLLAAVAAASPQQIDGWRTVCVLVSFPHALCARFRVALVLRGVRRAYERHCVGRALTQWRLLDARAHELYARALIAKNAFRYRFQLRVGRKARQAALLRQFLGGLSVDVRFSLAMKRVKRRVQLLQRWWRHAQLMVRARELALFHKWVAVEARLRLEYLNQLPHLRRVFQSPRQRVPPARRASLALGSPLKESSPSAAADAAKREDAERLGDGGGGDDDGLPLHRLLNLPEQRAWFSARFSLAADGALRAWDAGGAGAPVIELRGYRCHLHAFSPDDSDSDSDSDSEGGDDDDRRAARASRSRRPKWRPYLMLFRPGAFRFLLLTTQPSASAAASSSSSSSTDELLDWLAKLEERAAAASPPSGSSRSAGVSVRELVNVSMTSGILSTPRSSADSTSPVAAWSSPSSPAAMLPTSSPRGKLQARVRSIRQSRGSRVGSAAGLSGASLLAHAPPLLEDELRYYVVDLLKDLPKVPQRDIWQTVRDKLRDKRKLFRADIHRFQLESAHFRQHQEQLRRIHVPDKFRDFFSLEKPKRPHFRSLISTRKLEAIIRQTIDQVRASQPSNPRVLLDLPKP